MKEIDKKLLDNLTKEAQSLPRKRKNYNFHQFPEDVLQRMLNAFEPETYVRPHKHENPDKREVFILLRGKAVIVQFNGTGKIIQAIHLDQAAGKYGVEIPPRVYHTILSLEAGTVMYELKDGPYLVENDKDFAAWAPEEGSAEASTYLTQLKKEIGLFN